MVFSLQVASRRQGHFSYKSLLDDTSDERVKNNNNKKGKKNKIFVTIRTVGVFGKDDCHDATDYKNKLPKSSN